VTEPTVGATTSILKSIDADAWPSLTLIRTVSKAPVLPAGGVPWSRPVPVLNVAQSGLLTTLNANRSPSGSLAVGWKV